MSNNPDRWRDSNGNTYYKDEGDGIFLTIWKGILIVFVVIVIASVLPQ
jgi:hypothetical protein